MHPHDAADDDELRAAEHAADKLYRRAKALSQAGRHAESLTTYADLVDRFGHRDERPLAARVAEALLKTSIALTAQREFERSAMACDLVLDRFARRDDLDEHVARALVGKVTNTLSHTRKWTEAVTAPMLEFYQRFGSRPSHPFPTLCKLLDDILAAGKDRPSS